MKNFNSHWEEHLSEDWKKGQFRSKLVFGLLVIAGGVLLMLRQLGYAIPTWALSWPMIMIGFGLVAVVKHNFKSLFGYIVMGVGGIFLMKRFHPEFINTDLMWPTIIIILGISVLYKAFVRNKKKGFSSGPTFKKGETLGEDQFESSAVFGGVNKQVVSKNFRKGEINSVFGGSEINMSQADFTGEAKIEANAVFGGITLIIPANWKVKSDLNSVFGSVEDKRPTFTSDEFSEDKILYIEGNCVFGGIEIKSF